VEDTFFDSTGFLQLFGDAGRSVAFGRLANGLAQAEGPWVAPPAFLLGRQVAAAELSGAVSFQVEEGRQRPAHPGFHLSAPAEPVVIESQRR
jgi:hypothetical protein